jgi:predicted ATPase
VTVTGTGGIGKTSVALHVARRTSHVARRMSYVVRRTSHVARRTSHVARRGLGDFPDGGRLVELTSLADPALVQSAVARVLGLTLNGELNSAETIARAIGNRHLLLLLDNCEQVVHAVAELVQTWVRLCPSVTILATSREALSIDGEAVYPLAPLGVPAIGQDQPDVIRDYSAVQLFAARMTALNSDFRPAAEELLVIGEICRRLDGIPLAIEFAAARAASLGAAHVASGLGDRFAILTSGLCNPAPRHRTLLAVLDWSYQLLSEEEKSLLRHLAIFPAGFKLEAAGAVARDELSGVPLMLDDLASLESKSLVTSDDLDSPGRWRLLETTRAYALQKLAAHGETETARYRHARYLRELCTPPGTAACWRASREELAVRARELDNIRASLDWCFSASGDAEIGKDLTAAYLSVWLYRGLPAECREWCERASRIAERIAGPMRDVMCGSGPALAPR